MAEPSVRVSGIVLASMMFQHVSSDSDVEGLLVGEVTVSEQVTLSDSQTEHVVLEETFNVHKQVCCQRPQQFYSGLGDVDERSLRSLLADQRLDDVVGWYRQRRGAEHGLTLRERRVHQSLKRTTSNPNMVFMLLRPSEVTSSTHRLDYSALVCPRSRFINVPVTIHNLGVLDQSPYWTSAPTCASSAYTRTVTRHRSGFFSAPELLRDVSEMSSMNRSLQAELQDACGAVAQSERQVGALWTEVSRLRRSLREKKRRRAGAGPSGDARNRLLQDAVRTLLLSSPLYGTQTLTLDGFPVPADPPDLRGSDGSGRRHKPCERSLTSPLRDQRRRWRTSVSPRF